MLRDLESETEHLFGASPQVAQKDISLLDILIVLMRHRGRILLWMLGAVCVGFLICLTLPVRYTSVTSILPPQQGSLSTGAALMAQLGTLSAISGGTGPGAMGLKNPNDLQVAMLRSQTVEDAMIVRFHLAQLYRAKNLTQARKLLEKWVDIDSSPKDGLIRISVTDSDPRRAAEIANGYVDEFKKFSATLSVTEASQRRLFFEQQLVQAKDKLADSEESLKETEQQTGVIQIDAQTRASIDSLASLRAQIAEKEVEIRGLQSFATTANPDVEQANEELSELRAQAEKLGSSANGTSNGLLVPKGVMQDATLEYTRKLRDVKYYQFIFDLLGRQYEAAKIDEARQGAYVQIVDRALVPDQRSSPKTPLVVIGSAVLGMLIGIGWAFASEGVQRLARNPLERERLKTLRALMPTSGRKAARYTSR